MRRSAIEVAPTRVLRVCHVEGHRPATINQSRANYQPINITVVQSIPNIIVSHKSGRSGESRTKQDLRCSEGPV